jgi:hypothetical protein
MAESFVEIIGYNLERVHAGVLAWLLDTRNESVPLSDKLAALSRLAGANVAGTPIQTIRTCREYSFGRRLKIDLVIEIELRDKVTRSVAVELKTDSDIDVRQLARTREAYASRDPDARYFVFALGAGQFTIPHQAKEIDDIGFQAVPLGALLEIFGNLSIKGKSRIYDDWISSLERELERNQLIWQNLSKFENPWADGLEALGYRRGFPLFYAVYSKLRQELDKGAFANWAIYSGRNNPVMNWSDGWVARELPDESWELFWEFNWDALCLKAHLDKIREDRWSEVRCRLLQACEAPGIEGRRANKRAGEYVSVFKWHFNFCNESAAGVSAKVSSVIQEVHPRLQEVI